MDRHSIDLAADNLVHFPKMKLELKDGDAGGDPEQQLKTVQRWMMTGLLIFMDLF